MQHLEWPDGHIHMGRQMCASNPQLGMGGGGEVQRERKVHPWIAIQHLHQQPHLLTNISHQT